MRFTAVSRAMMIAALVVGGAAKAAELKVLSGNGARAAVVELSARF
jgi:hypothetical protein